jgi:alpha-N-arabinofuranosidase
LLPIRPFADPKLGLEWNFRRSHDEAFHSLSEEPGSLRIRLRSGEIADKTQYSFTGIRQRDFGFEASTKMEFTPAKSQEEAGLIVIQNDRSAFLLTLTKGDQGNELTLVQ